MMSDIEATTHRPMGPGTLYAALARLEERGMIEPLAPIERRRPYRITGVGASILEELHAATLHNFIQVLGDVRSTGDVMALLEDGAGRAAKAAVAE